MSALIFLFLYYVIVPIIVQFSFILTIGALVFNAMYCAFAAIDFLTCIKLLQYSPTSYFVDKYDGLYVYDKFMRNEEI